MDNEVDRLTAEIEERIELREKLMTNLPDDDSARAEAIEKLRLCTEEIGDRLKRLDELGVKLPERIKTARG